MRENIGVDQLNRGKNSLGGKLRLGVIWNPLAFVSSRNTLINICVDNHKYMSETGTKALASDAGS